MLSPLKSFVQKYSSKLLSIPYSSKLLSIPYSLKLWNNSYAFKKETNENNNNDIQNTIYFKYFDKKEFKKTPVKIDCGNDTILTAAHKNGIPLEGACEGSLACSTCHVICSDDSLCKNISDRENDLLDKAYGVRPTSRLGCQIKISKEIDGFTFEIPKATRNLAIDGYKSVIH